MDKITPCLWFEDKCEEAINFYMSLFENSEISTIMRYPNEAWIEPWKGMEGKIMTATFKLAGQDFMALDGGSYFKFNPTVSFSVNCDSVEEVQDLYGKLSDGGSVMMPLDEYPFSKQYAWVQDRYGVSWQLSFVENYQQKIVPSLMFVGDMFGRLQEALDFYTSVFKHSSLEMIAKYEPGDLDEVGKIKYSSFKLEGQPFIAMESGLNHEFEPNGAISFQIECQDQAEVDYYWEKLAQGHGAMEEQCGWLKDQFGFSWQIVPKRLGELLTDPDKEKSDKALKAMLEMKKIIVDDLEKAVRN